MCSRVCKPDHEQDEEVTAVGIGMPGGLHLKRLNAWMSTLLRERGPAICRMQGALGVKGEAEERGARPEHQ